MTDTAVSMPSVTHCMKAKKLLTALGYKCDIKRLSGRTVKGCTHYISVNISEATLLSILERNNIKHGEVITEAVVT